MWGGTLGIWCVSGFLCDIDIGDVDVVANGDLILVRIYSLWFARWSDGG